MNKTIKDIFASQDLEHSVLIGYYGGGNFGDELLLEVLMNLFADSGVSSLTVTYQDLKRYPDYHHDFGYSRIDMGNKLAVFRSILKNKNIIIGGGGLWGLDVNPNIFILSSLLFVSRYILRKRVYMLGVGYYNSTSRLGHISAWLAGKSARHIVVRDTESEINFKTITKNVTIDRDIAFQIPSLDLEAYQDDRNKLQSTIPIDGTTLFVTIRRFKPNQKNSYNDTIEQFIANNPKTSIVVTLLEPRHIDPDGYDLIQKWQRAYGNVRAFDFLYNPIALFLFFKKHHDELILIAPQFHAIIAALLTDVPFAPIVYDNKVAELLKATTNPDQIPINDLSLAQLQTFITEHKQSRG